MVIGGFNLDGETLMVAPAKLFSILRKGLATNQIEFAYVLEKEVWKEAVHILKEALKVISVD